MKVAFLSFDFGEYCIRLATALAQEAQVLLLLPQHFSALYVAKLGQAVNLRTFAKPRLREPWRQARTITQLLWHIRDFAPDLIHLQQGHLWFNCALPLLRQYPMVLTIHDPTHHFGDWESRKTPQAVMNFGYRRADQLIVHSERLKRVVVDQLHLPGETVHVIPTVVRGDDTMHTQVQEDEGLILFFGRIWGYKGLEYLIRAEPLITAQVPGARILIAGRGEDFARYQRLMVHPDRFIVHNEYVSDEKRAELFRRASVVALPYVEASQSGVIPVAYTFAKPVVATTVGGLPELVDDGRTGYLVPPRDEKALADAIVRLLQDKELRDRLGANGKRKIMTECSAEAVARKTFNVYCRALNGSKTLAERCEGQ